MATIPSPGGYLPINGLNLYYEVRGELGTSELPLLLIPGAFMATDSTPPTDSKPAMSLTLSQKLLPAPTSIDTTCAVDFEAQPRPFRLLTWFPKCCFASDRQGATRASCTRPTLPAGRQLVQGELSHQCRNIIGAFDLRKMAGSRQHCNGGLGHVGAHHVQPR